MMILRLIKNKTLLNVVEPTLENTSLEVGLPQISIFQPWFDAGSDCLESERLL